MAELKRADVLIIDDNEQIRKVFSIAASMIYGLTPKSFPNVKETLRYISDIAKKVPEGKNIRDYLPLGYIVDMRIPEEIGDEVNSSENLFYVLTEYNATEHFTFVTGHISDYDAGVQKRTGAKIIQKPDMLEELFRDIVEAKSRHKSGLSAKLQSAE